MFQSPITNSCVVDFVESFFLHNDLIRRCVYIPDAPAAVLLVHETKRPRMSKTLAVAGTRLMSTWSVRADDRQTLRPREPPKYSTAVTSPLQ